MKRILFFLSVLFAVVLWQSCEKEVLPGSIYGVVTDKATGEPIKSAGVELNPGGLKTVTGSEGQFEFVDLTPGKYNLIITKTGYVDFASSTIEVKEGQTARSDAQIELLPPALKVIDDDRKEISVLDFGSAEADVSRSFSIFNDGVSKLEWQITVTAEWIKSVSKIEGELSAGSIQSLIVTIDRKFLKNGENTTTLHITSNSGSKQLIIKAINNTELATLNTLPVTNVKTTSVVLNAEILSDGSPKYRERGFVYSLSSMPTIDNCIAKLTSTLTDSAKYSVTLTNLTKDQVYYVRAYAINAGQEAYSSNEISFVTLGSLPKVTTQEVTNIVRSEGKVTFVGNILSVGDPAYTERGFVYGTTHNPMIESDNKIIVSGKGTGEFYANAVGLNVGSIYYVRAYAINEQGTVYGEELTADFSAIMPKVETLDVIDISQNDGTATFKGKIIEQGDPTYVECGFVYGTTYNPMLENASKLVALHIGSGEFFCNVSDLQVGAIYYVRAYATNKQGTVYGQVVKFDFRGVDPQVSTIGVRNIVRKDGSAIFVGNILNEGAPIYVERGFVYGMTRNPMLENATNLVVSGKGEGEFYAKATDLEVGNKYYVRAYVANKLIIVYGDNVEFDFDIISPEVSTKEVKDIIRGEGTATFVGIIKEEGDPTYTERGFVYGTLHNPILERDMNVVVAGSGKGEFRAKIFNLEVGSLYYVRAYVRNEYGIIYGDEILVDFSAVMPEVKTLSAQVVTDSSVYVIGKVINNGDPIYIERGFIYGTMHTPTYDDNVTTIVVPNTSSAQFETEIKIPNFNSAIYYIRAYVKNSEGIAYGEILEIADPDYLAYIALPTFVHNNAKYRVYHDMAIKLPWEQAVSTCNNLTYGGYSDWILPSIDVLSAMYFYKETIGGFIDIVYYWSSTTTSHSKDHAYGFSFYDGVTYVDRKTTSVGVRCVRKEE